MPDSEIELTNVLHRIAGPKEGVDSATLAGIPKPYNSDFRNICAAVSPIEGIHVLRRVQSSTCVFDSQRTRVTSKKIH
jgi:hypothetical protein